MESATTLAGNVTRDPELRYTTGGKAVTTIGVACNRRYQVNGEWQEQVSFFDASCFGDLAENVAASVSKGDRVIVAGRLDQRSWDDKTTGDKRYAVQVVADEVGPSLRWAQAEVRKIVRETAAVPA